MKQEVLIEKYFGGSLSETERAVFERLLSEDAAFRREVELGRQLKETIARREHKALKHQLKGHEKKLTHNRRIFWGMAASVAACLMVFFVWQANRPAELSELYAAYYEPYRNVVAPIARGSESVDPKTRAFAYYEQQEYGKALEGFEAYLKEQDDPAVRFYQAISLMSLDRPKEALELLEYNLNRSDSLKDKHQWYLAMAYLRTGKAAEARTVLKALVSNTDSGFKTKEAKELLEQLE